MSIHNTSLLTDCVRTIGLFPSPCRSNGSYRRTLSLQTRIGVFFFFFFVLNLSPSSRKFSFLRCFHLCICDSLRLSWWDFMVESGWSNRFWVVKLLDTYLFIQGNMSRPLSFLDILEIPFVKPV